MEYRFKLGPELWWAVLVAVLTAMATQLMFFDAADITDWRVWAVGLVSALVRAGFGAILAGLTRVDKPANPPVPVGPIDDAPEDRIVTPAPSHSTLPKPAPRPPYRPPRIYPGDKPPPRDLR